MNSTDSRVFEKATQLIGSFFQLATVSEQAIQAGYLTNVKEILNTTCNLELVRSALWGLSNLVCENYRSTQTFFCEQDLVQRIIVLAQNPSELIRTESLWVLTNAITSSEPQVILWMFNNEGKDLFHAFGKNLKTL